MATYLGAVMFTAPEIVPNHTMASFVRIRRKDVVIEYDFAADDFTGARKEAGFAVAVEVTFGGNLEAIWSRVGSAAFGTLIIATLAVFILIADFFVREIPEAFPTGVVVAGIPIAAWAHACLVRGCFGKRSRDGEG